MTKELQSMLRSILNIKQYVEGTELRDWTVGERAMLRRALLDTADAIREIASNELIEDAKLYARQVEGSA
jgi:hypothetical protein